MSCFARSPLVWCARARLSWRLGLGAVLVGCLEWLVRARRSHSIEPMSQPSSTKRSSWVRACWSARNGRQPGLGRSLIVTVSAGILSVGFHRSRRCGSPVGRAQTSEPTRRATCRSMTRSAIPSHLNGQSRRVGPSRLSPTKILPRFFEATLQQLHTSTRETLAVQGFLWHARRDSNPQPPDP